MSSNYTESLLKTYNKYLNFNKKHFKSQLNQLFMRKGNPSLNSLNSLLNGVFSKPKILAFDKSRSDNRAKDIQRFLAMFEYDSLRILDIGAGDAAISLALKKAYSLNSQDILVLDDKTPTNRAYTKIYYDQNYNILLEDNSVNVIILFNVIHHIALSSLPHFFGEMRRVLSPGGVVIVREHDSDHSRNFSLYLNLIHLLWYRIKNEEFEIMNLFSFEEMTELFSRNKFKLIHTESLGNLQKLYYSVFQKWE